MTLGVNPILAAHEEPKIILIGDTIDTATTITIIGTIEVTDPVLATCNDAGVCSGDCTTEGGLLTNDDAPCKTKDNGNTIFDLP